MHLLALFFVLAFSPLKAETQKESTNLNGGNQFSGEQCSLKKKMCNSKTTAELSEEIKKAFESN